MRKYTSKKLTEWKLSNLTKEEFCEAKGIKNSTFHNWVCRNKKTNTSFAKVTPVASKNANPITISFSNEFKLDIPVTVKTVDVTTVTQKILDEFRLWLDDRLIYVTPKSLTGKALHYLNNEWSCLVVFLEDGDIALDNNYVENAIRPFALGRKNWLFSSTHWLI